jgi:hypothetical protein
VEEGGGQLAQGGLAEASRAQQVERNSEAYYADFGSGGLRCR